MSILKYNDWQEQDNKFQNLNLIFYFILSYPMLSFHVSKWLSKLKLKIKSSYSFYLFKLKIWINNATKHFTQISVDNTNN